MLLAANVDRLYRAILPDRSATDFSAERALFVVMAQKIRSFSDDPDISHVMDTIDDLLDKWITWGRRFGEETHPDQVETQYDLCYGAERPDIVKEMIYRRREKLTLDAMRELVDYLGGMREERKAILAVSEGWAVLKSNTSVANSGTARRPLGTRSPRSAPHTLPSRSHSDRGPP